MDLSDPKTWTDVVKVVIEGRGIVVPLLIASVWGTWWVRGWTAKAKIVGLQEQNKVLEEKNKLLESYRQFAEARVNDIDQKLIATTAQLTTLQDQIKSKAPQEGLLKTANSTMRGLGELRAANTELIHHLHALDLTVQSPSFSGVEMTVSKSS
jgi:hypothetical protein